ncbi:TPA: hypothetical protein HA249_06370 [Candidatus Woesearchaeota archaeon]|nr:hypothetical protein [Candidatus Woesearchaeota archaeon]HII88990.1 hypothetical protein [Candidatus Woesearchaeota archaeon]
MTPKQKFTTALIALALATLSKSAIADFYDGARGPSRAQVHYTTQSSDKHSIALKYFGDHLFAVGVGNANAQGPTGYFGGLGLILEGLERIKAIPVLGYGLSPDGTQGTAVGVVQATVFVDQDGTFLLDPRYVVAVPAHGNQQHTPQQTLGLTASAGNTQCRIGADVTYPLRQQPTLDALVRYDIDAKTHTSWVQFGIGQSGAQLQVRGNF